MKIYPVRYHATYSSPRATNWAPALVQSAIIREPEGEANKKLTSDSLSRHGVHTRNPRHLGDQGQVENCESEAAWAPTRGSGAEVYFNGRILMECSQGPEILNLNTEGQRKHHVYSFSQLCN